MLNKSALICRPISRLRLHVDTQTETPTSRVITSKYSAFEARKNIFSNSPFRKIQSYEIDDSKIKKDEEKTLSEVEMREKARIETGNVNTGNVNKLAADDKSEFAESKQIILKSLDSKSEEDVSSQNVIKSKSDNLSHPEYQKIESPTEKSRSEEKNVSLKIFVKHPLRRSAKNRKHVRRNRLKTKDRLESPDPLEGVEIRSAAQWRAISPLVTWRGGSQDKLHTEETKETEVPPGGCGGRVRGECPDRPVTITPPSARDFPPHLQAEMTSLAEMRNVCWRIKPW